MKIVENVSMESVFRKIGFLPIGQVYKLDFENCKLSAFKGINQYFLDGYNLFGYYTLERTTGIIEFFIPLKVESYEQGLALLAYPLRNTKLENKPSWLNEGLRLKEHLPWEKELKAFEEKPSLIVEREWFRVLIRKIKLLVTTATENDVTIFSYEGNVFRVVCNNEAFVINGTGDDWQRTAIVKTQLLDFLPKRITNNYVNVYIWKDQLHIGNRTFKLET